jgi:hypothetical protein
MSQFEDYLCYQFTSVGYPKAVSARRKIGCFHQRTAAKKGVAAKETDAQIHTLFFKFKYETTYL